MRNLDHTSGNDKDKVICPHTVSDIPSAAGGYLQPKDCVLTHATPEPTLQEQLKEILNECYSDRPADGHWFIQEHHLEHITTRVSILIEKAERKARLVEAGIWLNMVTSNDQSKLDSNEWYKIDPKTVTRFWAKRFKELSE